MDRRIIPLLSLSGIFLTGFSDPAPLADARDVALGQKAYVDGPVIEPVAVLEDSRCPQNVRCVWAGQVRVRILWHRPGGREETLDVVLRERTPIADGSIMLEAVHPARLTAKPIAPQDYRFAFRFDGGL